MGYEMLLDGKENTINKQGPSKPTAPVKAKTGTGKQPITIGMQLSPIGSDKLMP
jgi:hypothetical protein